MGFKKNFTFRVTFLRNQDVLGYSCLVPLLLDVLRHYTPLIVFRLKSAVVNFVVRPREGMLSELFR